MKKKIFIITLIVLCLVGTIWYHKEIPMKETMSFCSLEGDVIDVNFDITKHRSFFSPTYLLGKVTIGKDVYSNNLKGRVSYENFWARFEFKLRYGYGTSSFYKPYQTAIGDRILVTDIIGDFEYVCILVYDENEKSSVSYYGPAQNKETARAIMTEIVKKLTQ